MRVTSSPNPLMVSTFALAVGAKKNTFTVTASKMIATIAASWFLRIGISHSVVARMRVTWRNVKCEKSQVQRLRDVTAGLTYSERQRGRQQILVSTADFVRYYRRASRPSGVIGPDFHGIT